MNDKVNAFGCPVPIYDDYIIIQNHRNDLPWVKRTLDEITALE